MSIATLAASVEPTVPIHTVLVPLVYADRTPGVVYADLTPTWCDVLFDLEDRPTIDTDWATWGDEHRPATLAHRHKFENGGRVWTSADGDILFAHLPSTPRHPGGLRVAFRVPSGHPFHRFGPAVDKLLPLLTALPPVEGSPDHSALGSFDLDTFPAPEGYYEAARALAVRAWDRWSAMVETLCELTELHPATMPLHGAPLCLSQESPRQQITHQDLTWLLGIVGCDLSPAETPSHHGDDPDLGPGPLWSAGWEMFPWLAAGWTPEDANHWLGLSSTVEQWFTYIHDWEHGLAFTVPQVRDLRSRGIDDAETVRLFADVGHARDHAEGAVAAGGLRLGATVFPIPLTTSELFDYLAEWEQLLPLDQAAWCVAAGYRLDEMVHILNAEQADKDDSLLSSVQLVAALQPATSSTVSAFLTARTAHPHRSR